MSKRDRQQEPEANVEPQVTGPGVEANVDSTPAGSEAEHENVPAVDELADLRSQRDEYHDQLLRTQADFANFQRRLRAQAEADRQYAIGPLALDLLGILDNFERAIEAARSSDAASIVEGLEMVHKQLLGALSKHGVEPIEALGQPFDPAWHEALTQMPDPNQAEGTVVAELSKGYKLHERVLRPSRVAVSVKPSSD